MTKLLSKGNAKLHKSVGIWSIIASQEVCGRECEGCYAIKEQNRWKGTIISGRTNRLELSKGLFFREQMIEEINKSKYKYIRIHGSGEFYSQEYVDKWTAIVRNCPDKLFYAYTKRHNEFNFEWLESLDNFILHRSTVKGSRRHYLNFGDSKYLERIKKDLGHSKVFECPLVGLNNGGCGSECTFCMDPTETRQIVFKQH